MTKSKKVQNCNFDPALQTGDKRAFYEGSESKADKFFNDAAVVS